ncbi:TlpA family protein disulfide reductase [Reichenbachiella ulvae]|uniref:TlpA family protein disulfide reductase n=1 Tax=Reichenbachiella ulvae TaxID=2980104 RepID=UPI00384C8019
MLSEGAQLQATAGQYTYLQLWGSWCQPCLDQTPKIKALQNDFGQKLNIIGVNYKEENAEDAQSAISTNDMDWAQVQANEDLIKNLGSPGFVPCGILFDEQGQLVKYGVSPAEVRTLLSTSL